MQRKINLVIWAFVLVFGIFEHAVFAQSSTTFPFGFPTSHEDGNQVLSLREVRNIASYQARLTWGRAYRIVEIPCVDLNDSLIAYQVIFRLVDKDLGNVSDNDETALTEETYMEIQQKIRNGRELFRAASERVRVAEQEMRKRISRKEREIENSSENGIERDLNRVQRKPTSISPTEEFKNAYEEREKGRRLMTGAGSYGTVLVTVQEGLVPVPVVSHGLPHFYTKADLMEQVAKSTMGKASGISKIYMTGPLDQWYEFKTEQGEKLLIDPFRIRAIISEKAKADLPKKLNMVMPKEEAMAKRHSLLQNAHRESSK
jgi:hypothetical protein